MICQYKHIFRTFINGLPKNDYSQIHLHNIQSTYIQSRNMTEELHAHAQTNKFTIAPGSNIDKVIQVVSNNTNERIQLLREPTVIMWLYGDLSFLPPIEKKNKTQDEKKYKTCEDEWGRNVLHIRRPDLKLDKQWTNKFGEHLFEELQLLIGKPCKKPENKEHYEPDFEVDDCIWEVKTGTYHTTGTAGEKILGSPFKYAEVPQLYGKCLKIICMGGAEKVCREQYGNLPGEKCSVQKKKFIDFFKENGIEFIAATDFLDTLLT